MKIKFSVFTVLLALFAIQVGHAQNVSIGLRAGTAHYTIDNNETNIDFKYTTGLYFAIPVEIELSERFALQPELTFTQKGSAVESKSESGADLKLITKTNYLELPILFKGTFSAGNIKLHAFAGPSIGYALNRYSMENIGDADGEKKTIDFIDSGNIQDQRWDLSAVGGIGASVKVGIGSIVLDGRYSYGFTDNVKFESDKPSSWSETSNRGFNASLGYMIPLNSK